jgi:radical SAM superfamily enzyme YgiQ (UPF0313 family)
VIITSTSPYSKWRCPQFSYSHALNVLKNAKKYNCKTIIYGPHCSISPNIFFNYADCIIIGEPESVILQAISSNEKLIAVKEEKIPDDLDTWGFPAFELIEDFSLYNAKYTFAGKISGKLGTLSGSRGCPYNCYFCLKVMIPKKVRFHKPETAVKMAEVLVKDYGCCALAWQDLTFALDKEWTLEVCKGLERLKVPYAIWTRSDKLLDKDIVNSLVNSGCFFVGLGIESGNNQVLLKGYNKGYTWEESKRAILLCRDAGIPVIDGFRILFGPYETKHSIKETQDKYKEVNLPSNDFAICTPYPHTKLWDIGIESKKIPSNLKDWDAIVNIITKVAGTIGNDFSRNDVIKLKKRMTMSFSHIILSAIKYYRQFGIKSFFKRTIEWIKRQL